MWKRKAYEIFRDEKSDNELLQIPGIRKLFDHDFTLVPEERDTRFFRDLQGKILHAFPSLSPSSVLVFITAPAWFSTTMISSVTESATIAGFKALRIITEHTAAASALMFRNYLKMSHGQVSVIYDLGGGTFDATIIRELWGKIDVLANEDNIGLGVKTLMNHFEMLFTI